MTDRVATLTVILDKEYRVDDIESIIDAIQMVKGVHRVKQGEVCDGNHYMNKSTVAMDLWGKINKVFKDEMGMNA